MPRWEPTGGKWHLCYDKRDSESDEKWNGFWIM